MADNAPLAGYSPFALAPDRVTGGVPLVSRRPRRACARDLCPPPVAIDRRSSTPLHPQIPRRPGAARGGVLHRFDPQRLPRQGQYPARTLEILDPDDTPLYLALR